MSEVAYVPLTVVIPTYNRAGELASTLNTIMLCRPLPSEIIIHIDWGDAETETMLLQLFPEVKIIKSNSTAGPGGGRSKCITAANNE